MKIVGKQQNNILRILLLFSYLLGTKKINVNKMKLFV